MTSNVPEIRFEGYDGEWDQGNILKNVQNVLDFRGKSPTKFGMAWGYSGYLVLSALNVKDGYIDKTVEAKYGSKKLFEKWMGKERLGKGDIVFTTEAPLGNVAQIPDEQHYILNQRAVAFKLDQTLMSNEFFAYTLRSPKFQSRLVMKSSGGTAKGIGMKEFSKLSIIFPKCINEQQAIGSFFKELDARIALQQTSLDNLKDAKKGFLQKMFPKTGETTPEIRFDGFEEEWEEVKLGDVSDMFDNLRVPVKSSDRVYGETPYYGANGIQGYVLGYTHEGEYILIAEDGASDLKNYPVNYVNGRVWVNNHAHVVQGSSGIAVTQFLMYFIKSMDITPYLVGGGRAKLNGEVLKKLTITLPHINEQQAIGSFFKELDDAISLEERELVLLKESKKAFLQKMFV